MGKYQSGQMGQTVNLLAYAFGGSNPSLPTLSYKAKLSLSESLAFSFIKCLILPWVDTLINH